MHHSASKLADAIAQRVIAEHRALAARWLDRLRPLVTVGSGEIFPSPRLLDHIPELIGRIGAYLGAPSHEDIAANSAVVMKAQELGVLRHSQRASVHQILQEYDLLGGILMTFVKEEIQRLELCPSPDECIDIGSLVGRAISVLRRATIDTFLNRYTDTITAQTKQIESFNGMLSHELRQPVAVLQTATRLLQANPLSRTADKFDVLARNVDRIIEITRQLEQLARIGVAKDGPATQAVNLTAAVSGVARQLREMAELRHVDIRIGPDLPSIVTDTARLELVLINLLSNAIKYSDPAKVDRFLEVRGAEAPRDRCAVTIRDNGIGVPPGHLAEIFGRFVRAHRERDEELGVRGMGLGLSIVRECLDAMGGTITVESVETQGTTFTMTLPADGHEQGPGRVTRA